MKRLVAFTVRGNNTPLKRLLSSKFPIISLAPKNQLLITSQAFFSSSPSPVKFEFTDLIDSFKYEEMELKLKTTYLESGVAAMVKEFEVAKRKKTFDIQTYEVVLRQICIDMKRNLTDHLKVMEEIYEDISRNKLTPTDSIINTMVSAYIVRGNMEKALEYLKLLKGMRSGFAYIAYARILTSLGTQKKYHEMEGLFREARQDPKAHRSAVYNAVLKTYVRLGETEEVERILRAMQEDRVKLDLFTFEILLEFYAKQGKIDKIKTTVGLMQQKGFIFRKETYSLLIQAYVSADDISSALHCLQQLKTAHISPDFRIFGSFLKYFCVKNVNRHRVVESLYAFFVPNSGAVKGFTVPDYLLGIFEFLRKNEKPLYFIYTNLIFIAGIHNRLHMALTLLQQATQDGFPPTTEVCNTILRSMVEHKHIRELEKFAEKMKQSGIPFDQETHVILKRAQEEREEDHLIT